MTLDQLRTFLWVSRLGGVRKAAQKMNITQPAVSGRIAALEESLGTTLFERTHRGVTRTEQGVLLHDYAEKIIELMERSLDLAILMGPISEYSIANIELPSIELAWFTSTQKGAPDLRHTPIISYNRNSRPYRELRRQLSKLYGDDSKIFPSSSIHAGFEMVASGIGVGLFPKQLGTELIRQGRIREFDPGWKLQPLKFTASYAGDPLNELCVHAAELAQKVAYHYPTV